MSFNNAINTSTELVTPRALRFTISFPMAYLNEMEMVMVMAI